MSPIAWILLGLFLVGIIVAVIQLNKKDDEESYTTLTRSVYSAPPASPPPVSAPAAPGPRGQSAAYEVMYAYTPESRRKTCTCCECENSQSALVCEVCGTGL